MNSISNLRLLFTVLFIILVILSEFSVALEYEDLDITYEFFTKTEENNRDSIHGELWVHLSWKAAQNEYVKYYYVYWNGEFSSMDDCCHRNIPMFRRDFRSYTRDLQVKAFEAAVEQTLSTSHTFGVEGVSQSHTHWVFDEVVYEPKLSASEPIPPDNFTAFSENTTLYWTPGDFTNSHNVYLGKSIDAMMFKGKQSGASYKMPEVLELGQKYFWRIDEITNSGVVHQGDIWCFTVADYLTVDNFENYTGFEPHRIFDTWIDGHYEIGYPGNETGAIVGNPQGPPYAELNIVHSGNQSMPFFYDNNKTDCLNYSETKIAWSKPRDLINECVQELSLWFRGDTSAHVSSFDENNSYTINNPEPLYIGISNSNGSVSVLNHPNPDATHFTDWTEWKIPLINFSTENVTLTDVNSLFIGVGYHNDPRSGGSGKLYFDDIRLYGLQDGDPIDIISTGFEVDQDDIETIVSAWIGKPWRLSSNAHTGDYSIQSADIENDQSTGFQIIIDSSVGTLYNVGFAAKTSTEYTFDVLKFSVNGVVKLELSGESGWSINTFPVLVETEQMVLEWIYTKDRSFGAGEDSVWLDDLLIQEL